MSNVREIGTFYLAPAAWQEPFSLEGPEFTHLAKAIRGRVGDFVCLLDGQGREGRFSITGITRHKALLAPQNIIEHPRPLNRAVLALGWNKALRRSWLLEKAVELDAGGVWFWQARHSQAALPEDGRDIRTGSLIAGAKQCRNPWLPDVKLLPGGATELAEASSAFKQRFLLHEDPDLGRMLSPEDISSEDAPLFILGPEGGFAPEEVAVLKGAGVTPVSLGKQVLRWETAALLCLGLSWWGRQG